MDAATPKQKVLVIDDDPTLRRLVQVIFERAGFDVSVASDGSEGIRLALMDPPHIVILDLIMKGLHGFEVCQTLRATASIQRTAIIIMSGKTHESDFDKALEFGADAYIVKPFSNKELIKIAVEHMNKRLSQP